MNEAADLFSDILSEKGVDATVVEDDRQSFSSPHTTIMVMKRLGSKKWASRIRLPDRSTLDSDDVFYKRLEQNAENIRANLESDITEEYSWEGTDIRTSKYDGGWAECRRCQDRVSFQGIMNTMTAFDSQELGTPRAAPRYRDEVISNLEGNQKVLFDLYMLGVMKYHSCNCPTDLQRGKLSKDL